MKKKIFSFICLALFAGTTVKAEVWTGYCGDNLQWSLDSETGVLEITGSGYMYSSDWRYDEYRNFIKTVILPDGLSNIYLYAFESCTNLISINIPNTVGEIGRYAFSGCSSLSSLTIPEYHI